MAARQRVMNRSNVDRRTTAWRVTVTDEQPKVLQMPQAMGMGLLVQPWEGLVK